jgi:predicted CopG family antitoxin
VLAVRKALKSYGVSQVAGVSVLERFLDDVYEALRTMKKAGASDVLRAIQDTARLPRWAPPANPEAALEEVIEREREFLRSRGRLIFPSDETLVFAVTGFRGGINKRFKDSGIDLNYRRDVPSGVKPRHCKAGSHRGETA